MTSEAHAAASLEGGSYDVIRRRLLEQAAELAAKAEALNQRRKTIFGGAELSLIANERVRTENNCIPRDIVSVAGHLLFGFQVFIGLRTETTVKDVLAFHRFDKTESGYDLSPVAFQGPGAFLADEQFQKELCEAFKYNKDARLLQLRRTDARLLAALQIGSAITDVKIFRWAIDAKGRVSYVDSRGEDDYAPPRQHDFEWTSTGREDQVPGPHPHINILNEVFVETVGGDLTIKVENNTKDGLGIYREPVDDANQTLDDSDIAYAKVGRLILLRVKPFREQRHRYLVFNTRTKHVVRIDAVGQACHELPDDAGIVFPGGYYLESGEHKVFESATEELFFERAIRSPNGEDVLYVYYRAERGEYLLLPFNKIRKEISSPLSCNGYSLFADGTMAIFRAVQEPTRVHPLQIWQTPFSSAEHAAAAPRDGSYLGKVGNADLVRGISDALELRRLASTEKPTRRTYEDLIAAVTRTSDAHYWLGHAEAGDMLSTVGALKKTSELVIDEFEKIVAIRRRAAEALAEATRTQTELLKKLGPEELGTVEDFLRALTALRTQRGHLIGLKEVREIDLGSVSKLEEAVTARFDEVSRACVEFFLGEGAFKPLLDRLEVLVTKIEATSKASELAPFSEELDLVQSGLTLLAEVVGSLKIDDATARTRILEGISAAFAQQNRARAVFQGRRKDLSLSEGRSEFAAQFKLFGQAVTGALALCDTPEKCDEELSKLLLQLEELEGRFGELDEFLADLAQKREEVADAVGARRQTLLDERNRRAQSLMSAAERILGGVARRARSFTTPDELNAYFASDPMVQKLGDIHADLAALGDSVRAEEVQSRLKTARQDALRALRDRADLFEGDQNVIKLGQHRFAVHSQPLELTLVPRDGQMFLHLTGTDFKEPIEDPALGELADLWDQLLVSESPDVYRGEYLAACMLFDAEHGRNGLSVASLTDAARSGKLLEAVRAYSQDRLDEGYERGIHDSDAALILDKLIALRATAGLLRFTPEVRALGCLYFAGLDAQARALLHTRARSLGRARSDFLQTEASESLAAELEEPLGVVAKNMRLDLSPAGARAAARYLLDELAADKPRFMTSAAAFGLAGHLSTHLEGSGKRRAFEDDLRALEQHPAMRFEIALAYLEGYAETKKKPELLRYAAEAAAVLVTEARIEREKSAATVSAEVTGLLGSHARIHSRTMSLSIDELLMRLLPFVTERAARFRALRQLKSRIVEREKKRLRLEEFQPRVLSSFVRNALIDQVYLPLIGTNLAKQIGSVGEKKRTDLMGLLLLVSPPGYGKTTLMEYIASKLGLVFMKVNGPALGVDVTSLDPNEAPSATSRQEVEKINLALEMGNNVMLYLDDIQHTSTELLQKFISLCDAQRRIEGVWRGRARTYDLRGKRFCVVMAGNPYTETGARFQIPDMLANRADTYNLGDILSGAADLFAQSYLENSLTSQALLAPLATRDPGDLKKLLRMAGGETLALTELAHGYSAAEVQEITAVLERMMKLQKLLLRVNQEYIASASQEDAYRTEPPFKLQGSYRNMNKLAEKVVAAMNDEELERLVDDHYTSEAQTLTTGAEQNLLKLAELRGRMSDEQRVRWEAVKQGYVRVQRAGGKGDDPVARVTGALGGVDEQLGAIRGAIEKALNGGRTDPLEELGPRFDQLAASLSALGRPQIEVKLDSGTGSAQIELLRAQSSLLERAMQHLATQAERAAKVAEVVATNPAPAIARTPAGPDPRMDQLVTMMTDLEGRVRRALTPALRFDVEIGADSPSNFYSSVGGDVIGVFVATYAKLPQLGATVLLSLALPLGARCQLEGVVEWTQDRLGDDGSPGFGARITAADEDARAMVRRFVTHREPLLRE